MKTLKPKHFKNTFLSFVAAATFLGCGNDDAPIDQLAITSENQQAVSAMVFDSIDASTPTMPSPNMIVSSSSVSKLLPNYSAIQAPPTSDASFVCSGGGAIDYTASDSTYAYDNCTHEGVTVDGDVKVQYDAALGKMTYTLKNYEQTSATKSYKTSETSYTISKGTISFTTTGQAIINETKIHFKNYSYDLTLSSTALNIAINGHVKNEELKKWVKVTTNQNIQLNDTTCPIAGDLTISGNGSALRVAFARDKSVDVFLNGSLGAEFASCKEFSPSKTVTIAGR